MTLNNLFDLLKSYQQSHKQLNDFGRGGYEEITTSTDQKFPMLWVLGYNGRYSEKAMLYNLQLVFADLLQEDKANELEVQSDMHLVALDTVAFLRDNPDYDFNLTGDVTVEFFTEKLADFAAGCLLTFTLKDPKPLERCVIPKD